MTTKHAENYLSHFGLCKEEIILCEACQTQAVDLHHIIRRSQGGSDKVDNIIALCRSCHNKAHFIKQPGIKMEEIQKIHNETLKNHLSKSAK